MFFTFFHMLGFDTSKIKYQYASLPESLTDLEFSIGDAIITLGLEQGWPTKRDKTEQNIKKKQSLVNDGSMGEYIIHVKSKIRVI